MKSLTEKHDEIYQEALDKIVELEEDYRQAVLAQPKQLAAQAIRDMLMEVKKDKRIPFDPNDTGTLIPEPLIWKYIADKLEQGDG